MTTRTNANPFFETDHPTSHVTVKGGHIDSNRELVKLRCQGKEAMFYAKPPDDDIDDFLATGPSEVRMHRNVATLFGSDPEDIRSASSFVVDTSVTKNEVHECRSATVHVRGSVTREKVAKLLRSHEYLLHDLEEVISTNKGNIHLDVVELSPTDFTTVRVTENTDLEFLDPDEYAERRRSGDGEGTQQQGGEEETDVDIDLSPEKPTTSFEDDIAGLEGVKETARMLLALYDPETKAQIEQRYGSKFAARGGSMLLYGPPGCGKTIVAEGIAYEAANNTNIEDQYGDVKFLPVKGGDILSRYPGEAERRVEAVFERAHEIAQNGFAVLFFDEIETLIPDRGDDDLQRHERSLTNAFLQEMQTDEMEDNLFVIGATNMPFTIDPAASRRFPVQEFIPQPDSTVMSEVWQTELAELESESEIDIDIDYDRLGGASEGYTPAEIADRVLGTDLQRELIQSVVTPGEPITPDTQYLMDRLDDDEPKTIRQFITSVSDEMDSLEGYPEMRRYVEEQSERLGISLGGNGGVFEQLMGDDGGGDQ
ncbi:ATP-binding protein [Halovenus salina]|uniref:ATP-binding protein n=1 Tax=Halovenus salina TaxID=1510225 RepID=A0ABD5W4M6_9EURY|nr:ATP-binding protein [Halovenus salina]